MRDDRRDRDYRRLIMSTRWRRLRGEYIGAHPLCEDCLAAGRVTAATQVHHVVPVCDAVSAAGKAALCFDRGNLRALCPACHHAAHAALGKQGRKQAARRREAALEWFKREFMPGEGDAGGA